jgi:drug/metabolite transporter (DMT)-like permease
MSGILAALLSPVFLGVAPILGKTAITAGMDPFSVAALRTLVAVGLLWLIYAAFFRRFLFIYPAGLMGCIVIGVINGIGSLFFYGGLGLLDASLAQLLNGMYLVFAVMISHAAGIKSDRRTLLRVLLALIALMLITGFGEGQINVVGVGLMLGSALMFAGTVTLSQYVLYEMPSQTATLYILTTMCVVVSMVWLVVGQPLPPETLAGAALPVLLLGLTTAGSRLAIFAGVKFLGGMQTAIMAIAEILVSLALAFFLLGDRLTPAQWLGVAVLGAGLLLIRHRDLLPAGYNPNALIVANMASVQFQRIAFHRAFGTHENDNELGTMSALTTQEIIAIGRMMGAQQGSVDPFPISKGRRYINALDDDMTPPR